jgi:protein SCO1/2
MKKILAIFVLLVIFVPLAYFIMNPSVEKKLPIINPIDVNQEMVDPTLLQVGIGHRIGSFEFENQDGVLISNKEVQGKVYVAEYFFATCKSICPIMNRQMQRIQSAYEKDNRLKLLSFTVDPDNDTPEQLKKYAINHHYIKGKWHFLTGKKKDLYRLARKSYFVLKPSEAQNLGDAGSDFIHTNNFVLIDQKQRIRGYYDGTNPKEVNQLIHDIGLVLEE